jgi:CubicO group peptidase (beta-lactamase class C family)
MKNFITKAVLFTMSVSSFAQVNFDNLESVVSTLKSTNSSTMKVSSKLPQTKACSDFLNYAQNKMNTSGLIVIKDGEAVAELYGKDFNAQSKVKVWSISKYLSGLMLGAQVKKHGMSLLDERLVDFGIERKKLRKDKVDSWDNITLRNVWNMSSGINWCEYRNCRAVDYASMFYGKGFSDPVNYVLSQPLSHEPGTYYRYSAGNFMLLQHALREIIGEESYLDSAYDTVLKKLGANKNEYAFEVSPTGLFLGGSGLHVNARTFAKLGQILINKGQWEGEEVISADFFKEMTSNSDAIKNSPFEVQNWEGPSGGSIWLNDDSTNGDGLDRDGIPSFMPTSPWDMIYAGGNYGQFLLVYPSSNLVVARLGADASASHHWQPFSEKALKCFDPSQIRENKDSGAEKTIPETGKNLTFLRALSEGIITASRVHELCSCLFVTGLDSVKKCEKAMPTKTEFFLGIDSYDIAGKVHIDRQEKSVTIYKALGLKSIVSKLNKENPQLGCQLIK